ncbi:MAG: alcohol dehydrogenase catalytic domain-containing protein [Anaerolineae bacterium]|nr:alcohol dehydrogenase catalytic domain-containing protein [Anaerolineae bacterium]
MLAARLYGARDMRIDEVPEPPPPGPGEVQIAVTAVGICGSDLHTYEDGRIGNTTVESPLIMGHEFAGVVVAVGPDAYDGLHELLQPGQRVAVDPATPCWHCEMCEHGHPNLCLNLSFYGLWPHDGALQERFNVTARNCFPIPDALSDADGVLLEPLGVAIHSADLGNLHVTDSAVVLGCGPIGLLTMKMARLAGADPIYAFDRFPWRAEKAKSWGATDAWTLDEGDPVAHINELTNGRGVDVVFEAAWADQSIQQAADMARLGGRLVLIGIPGTDQMTMQHSVARRKGLTIMMVRRMKHVYPRAIHLALSEAAHVDLEDLVSHRMPLQDVGQAFAMNARYEAGVHKVIVEISSSS